MNIFSYKKYHFIGIGGIGISAIAKMLHLQNKDVSGSDLEKSEITDDLKKLGIKIFIGQKAKNIKKDTEIVIYTIAIKTDNPEILEAKRKGIVCLSYPEALGVLSKKMFTIAVSGTHGKTTTTAMIGHILKKAGLDPTIIVGSKITGKNTNFLAGKSKYLVVEACEYRRSFLNLWPSILLITNIEPDHLDYYKDLNDIKSAFKEFEQKVISNNGLIIKESDYKKVKTDFKLLIPGKHNLSNAQAAIKTATIIGVSDKKAKNFLKDFRGTWRRLEYKGKKDNKIFYDDYAHHPTEIKASLLALRDKYPNKKLVCVFEPHQQSRTRLFFDDFISALRLADQVFITPIFITREINDGKTTNKTLANALKKFVPTTPIKKVNDLKRGLKEIGSSKSICVVLMGAGNIYKWTNKILKNK